MAEYKITAPNPRFNGTVGGAEFRNGAATVKDGSPALAYCRRRGYTVEPVQQEQESPKPKQAKPAAKKTGE